MNKTGIHYVLYFLTLFSWHCPNKWPHNLQGIVSKKYGAGGRVPLVHNSTLHMNINLPQREELVFMFLFMHPIRIKNIFSRGIQPLLAKLYLPQ